MAASSCGAEDSDPVQMVLSATQEELTSRFLQNGLGDSSLIRRALEQAWRSHAGQTRDDGSDYLEQHVYPVTLSVIEYLCSIGRKVVPEVVAAALLHDTLEDDDSLTNELFLQRFGDQVYGLLKPLTKERSDLYPGKTKSERERARNTVYHLGLVSAPHDAQIIKVLDRLNNISWIHTSPDPTKQARYIAETEGFYLHFVKAVNGDLGARLANAIQQAKARCGVDNG